MIQFHNRSCALLGLRRTAAEISRVNPEFGVRPAIAGELIAFDVELSRDALLMQNMTGADNVFFDRFEIHKNFFCLLVDLNTPYARPMQMSTAEVIKIDSAEAGSIYAGAPFARHRFGSCRAAIKLTGNVYHDTDHPSHLLLPITRGNRIGTFISGGRITN